MNQHNRADEIVEVLSRTSGALAYSRDEAIAGIVFICTTLVRSGHTTMAQLPPAIRDICLDYFTRNKPKADEAAGAVLAKALNRDLSKRMLHELQSIVRSIATDGGEAAAEKLARLSAIAKQPTKSPTAGLAPPTPLGVRSRR